MKTPSRKLKLHREQIRTLTRHALSEIAGGLISGPCLDTMICSHACGGPVIPNLLSVNIPCRPSEGPTCR